MGQKEKPKIVEYTGSDYTRVTFWPDLKRFGMKQLDKDIVGLMMKRVYDIAGATNRRCKVVLNGKPLPFAGFHDYVQLYVKGHAGDGGDEEGPPPLIYEKCNGRRE